MDGERAARHQQERIQRVIEIESNNEMDRMVGATGLGFSDLGLGFRVQGLVLSV